MRILAIRAYKFRWRRQWFISTVELHARMLVHPHIWLPIGVAKGDINSSAAWFGAACSSNILFMFRWRLGSSCELARFNLTV